MIPKTIHYCWFGKNKKPALAKRCISSWHKKCPDYTIIEWNEENYDLCAAPLYVRQAYEQKKWAFVTDFVRLWVISEFGGVYLDTDVELIKPLNPFLKYSAFFGMEDNNLVATGLGFGAEKGMPVLKHLMSDYLDIPFMLPDGTLDTTSCPVRNTSVFQTLGFVPENRLQILQGNIAVFPTQYFCPLSYITGKKNVTSDTVSIHWYSASWLSEKQREYNKRVRKNKRLRPIKDKLKKVLGHRLSALLKRIVYGNK